MKFPNLNLNSIRLKLRKTKSEVKTMSEKAHKDWKIILITFSILWIVIFLLDFRFFLKISKSEYVSDNSSSLDNQAKINSKLLEQVINAFESRKIVLEELKTKKVDSPDPSI